MGRGTTWNILYRKGNIRKRYYIETKFTWGENIYEKETYTEKKTTQRRIYIGR